MAENTNSTEEVVDAGKKAGKQALNIIGKTLGNIIKPVLSVFIVLILLVASIYVIFKNDTADKGTSFEKYLDDDKLDKVEYE